MLIEGGKIHDYTKTCQVLKLFVDKDHTKKQYSVNDSMELLCTPNASSKLLLLVLFNREYKAF